MYRSVRLNLFSPVAWDGKGLYIRTLSSKLLLESACISQIQAIQTNRNVSELVNLHSKRFTACNSFYKVALKIITLRLAYSRSCRIRKRHVSDNIQVSVSKHTRYSIFCSTNDAEFWQSFGLHCNEQCDFSCCVAVHVHLHFHLYWLMSHEFENATFRHNYAGKRSRFVFTVIMFCM